MMKLRMNKLMMMAMIFLWVQSFQTSLEILGFNQLEKPSKQEIKNRFKQLSLKYHPDKNNEESSKNQYQQIVNAYEILKSSNYQEEGVSRKYFQKNSSPNYQKKEYQQFNNLEDIILSMKWSFVFETQDTFNQTEGHKYQTLQLTLQQFLNWCWDNTEVLIGAFLVSFGIINLCK